MAEKKKAQIVKIPKGTVIITGRNIKVTKLGTKRTSVSSLRKMKKAVEY